MVGFSRQSWPGYGMGNGGIMSSGYGGSPPAYQVCVSSLALIYGAVGFGSMRQS